MRIRNLFFILQNFPLRRPPLINNLNPLMVIRGRVSKTAGPRSFSSSSVVKGRPGNSLLVIPDGRFLASPVRGESIVSTWFFRYIIFVTMNFD